MKPSKRRRNKPCDIERKKTTKQRHLISKYTPKTTRKLLELCQKYERREGGSVFECIPFNL